MTRSEQAAADYLEIAYDVADGNPKRDFDQNEVENKLGMDEDRKRTTLRDLENRGLVDHQGGTRYRLTLPAIHTVEEKRLADGRDDQVDPRREERGTYVRVLYDMADGDTGKAVDINELLSELEVEPEVESRTRAYLSLAGLIEQTDDQAVRITDDGAGWVESS